MNQPPSRTLLRARTVAPVSVPPIDDGAVMIENGLIVDVDQFNRVEGFVAGVEIIDLGDTLLLPGLINAHTHLALSHLDRGPRPSSFIDWLLSIAPRLNLAADNANETLIAATLDGIAESIRAGVTCVGDITIRPGALRPAISKTPIRCVSFGEVLGLGKSRPRFNAALPDAIDRVFETDRLRVGLSPHAPYTVDFEGFATCATIAHQMTMPICTHLAEHPAEEQFLRTHDGLFRLAYERLGTWSDDVPRFAGSPIDFAVATGLLDVPAVLAHVNYITDSELERLARSRASVVYCPRTHAFFGHAPHRFRDMLRNGINVAVGTDSRASSPDLDVVAELRHIRSIAPEMTADQLIRLITINAAVALGLDDAIGTIEPGKHADFAAFDAGSLDELLTDAKPPSAVWIAGVKQSIEPN